MKNLYTILTILFISVTQLCAQNSLNGKIINKDQEPIAFATIGLKGGDGVLSDENGVFELLNIPNGQQTIIVSSIGYLRKTESVLIEDGLNQHTFQLNEDLNAIEEVVVTATMRETYLKDSPLKVEVISSKKLETYLPSASGNITKNIQLVNGVQEVIACGVCFTNEIRINGLPGQYTAILVDGTPMYGNLASVYGMDGIPNMIIDRFEVIKGPSSTLYGSEAVGGVINIITKQPKDEPDFSIDVMGTTMKESFGSISTTPKIGNTHGFIGLNYGYINNFEDKNNDLFSDGVNLDRLSLFSKWNIHREQDKKFTIAGKYYYEDRRNGVQAFLKNRAYKQLRGDEEIYGESIYTKRGELFGSYELSTKEAIKLDYSFAYHNQDSSYGSDLYKAKQTTGYINSVYTKDIEKHQLTGGVTLRYNAYDDNTVATSSIENNQEVNKPTNQFIPGIYLQDEIKISEPFTLLAGARLDHYDNHGLIFSPRLSAKINPTENLTIRPNFGTGFRVVNLFTEDHAFVTGQRQVEIKESLNPEESYNGSLSISQNYLTKGGGAGSIDVEGFYTYFTNKITPNYDTPNKIIYENSNGYATTKGLSLSANHSFAFPLSVSIGANWQRATENEEDIVSDIEFAPKFSGVATANYQLQEARMTFGYTANFTGKMTLPKVYDVNENGNQLATPRALESQPFSIHRFQVQKELNNGLKLYGGIDNIGNYRQPETPLVGYNDRNAKPGFSQFFDTSYAYAPNHGREGFFGIQWNMRKGE